MATVEEIEKRREERRKKHNEARDEQIACDLEAIDALESTDGAPLSTMTANGFVPGVVVKAAFRAPTSAEYKRYADMVGKAQAVNDPVARRKAQELLAEVCLVYPAKDSDERKAFLAAFPGVLVSVYMECAKAAELRAEDEGKA